jgi:hypothetical protein
MAKDGAPRLLWLGKGGQPAEKSLTDEVLERQNWSGNNSLPCPRSNAYLLGTRNWPALFVKVPRVVMFGGETWLKMIAAA